jgi:hypothetical protein
MYLLCMTDDENYLRMIDDRLIKAIFASGGDYRKARGYLFSKLDRSPLWKKDSLTFAMIWALSGRYFYGDVMVVRIRSNIG